MRSALPVVVPIRRHPPSTSLSRRMCAFNRALKGRYSAPGVQNSGATDCDCRRSRQFVFVFFPNLPLSLLLVLSLLPCCFLFFLVVPPDWQESAWLGGKANVHTNQAGLGRRFPTISPRSCLQKITEVLGTNQLPGKATGVLTLRHLSPLIDPSPRRLEYAGLLLKHVW